jgi:nucleoside-diphosphate-sugar epimerase
VKNILVIGANGMLGGEAVDYFNSMDGYSAKGLSRNPEFNFKETVI